MKIIKDFVDLNDFVKKYIKILSLYFSILMIYH